MQQPSQPHRRTFCGGAYVAVDPFRPSVSLGIKNIISGQDDPTIDDIPVTRPQTQPYPLPYQTQPYTQPGAYPIPYSQPVYATQPYSQPVYPAHPDYPTQPHTQSYSQPIYPAPPYFQPTYQTQPHTHAQPGFPTQLQPYPTQPQSQPMQPPVVVSLPGQVPVGVPEYRNRSRSRRSRRHSSRISRIRYARRCLESQGFRRARSPNPHRSRIPSSYSRSPRRPHSRSQVPRGYSASAERREVDYALRDPHGPRPRAHRRSSGELGSTRSASKVRGRSRSPKHLASVYYEGRPCALSSSSRQSRRSSVVSKGDDPNPSVTPSVLSHESRSPSHSPASPRIPPASPSSSPSPTRDRPDSPRVSPTSLHYRPASPQDRPAAPDEGQISAGQPESIPPTSRSRSSSPWRFSHPQPVGVVVNPPQAPPTVIIPQPVIVDMPPIIIIQQPPLVQQPNIVQQPTIVQPPPGIQGPSRSSSSSRWRNVSSGPDFRERPPTVIIHQSTSARPPSRSRSPIYRRQPSHSSSRYRGSGGHTGSPSRERRTRRVFHRSRSYSPLHRYCRTRGFSPRRRDSPLRPRRRCSSPSPPRRRYSPSPRYSPRRRYSGYSPRRRSSPLRPRRRRSSPSPPRRYYSGYSPGRRSSSPRKYSPYRATPVTVLPTPASETPSMRNWPLPSAIVGKDGRQGYPPTTVILPQPGTWKWNGYPSKPPVVPFNPYSPLQVPQDEDGEKGYVQYAVQARITEYAAAFLLDTIPRQIYLHFMLRLPSLYFRRVTRIFEEAEMTMPEIKKMALEAAGEWKDPMKDLNRGLIFEPQAVTPPYASLQSSWQTFIDSLMREWKTLNVISVLLLSAILTILQINAAAADPYTRYSALLSLVCALMSLLYGCLYIIRFGTMRKTYKAAEWATEAQKSRTSILWNVWVMLAMPATWLAWSMILYLFCIMSFVWRTGTTDDANIRPISPRDALGPRIAITAVFSLGLIYFLLIVTTFRRYGEMMDRAWQRRIWGWAQEKFGYQYAPQVYHTSYPPKPQTPVPYGSSVEHAAQPTSVPAYPARSRSHGSSRLPRGPARSRTPPPVLSLFPEVATLGPTSSSLFQTFPNRTRPSSKSPPRLGGTRPSRITVRSSAKSSSRPRERRLSPILAHIATTPFSPSKSRSISRTRVRSRLSSAGQLPPGMAEGVQCFKVLSISSEQLFRWSTPIKELVSRGVDDTDWMRFGQESMSAWNDKLDTLDNPERFLPGFDLPQDRLAQVLDWWNTDSFVGRGLEAVLDTDGSPATFAVYLLINGPLTDQSLADIATHFRHLPERLDRRYMPRKNHHPKLKLPDV